ncbi:D-2-hydroxyacid dehydrogenase family protein [Marinobacterium sp. LSUCC0821]|uniref:D-2-hydroxyacid dehydrogenase family protein n=1 Tax=Marinobacterium sp. LSUCC0821 TaxID=2668067 RepID=UPI001451EAEF|nr:D-2-hydroxyacid dehydrogenase family protein [Marinobacterium sp. LSUCC0821]QJD72073.1 D-2-hydroxyacid dehydrogenase family protein [Marinobacterium sp. LSUCC0821]
MKVHILDDWFDTLKTLPCFAKLDGHEVTVWTDHVEEVEQLALRLKDADAVVLFRERTAVTRELLEQLPNLKLISQRGVFPHVDVQACRDNNVLLCSKLPKGGGSPNYAAAELTWGLILSAMRQIPQQMQSLKAGDWQMGVGKSLRGRTLGLYGFGLIGQAVAEVGKAFGMRVQWWGSEEGRARAKAAGEYVPESREAFFASSDVVSLHLRLVPETRGIITLSDLETMRSDAVLVNTSRAGLIAPGALLAALNSNEIEMAAVDVFDTEPLTDATDELLNHARLIGTPHIGFVTKDEFNKQFGDAFDQINAFAAGEPLNMINPEIWKE